MWSLPPAELRADAAFNPWLKAESRWKKVRAAVHLFLMGVRGQIEMSPSTEAISVSTEPRCLAFQVEQCSDNAVDAM